MTESDLCRDKFVTFEQYTEKLSVEANELRLKVNKEQWEMKRLWLTDDLPVSTPPLTTTLTSPQWSPLAHMVEGAPSPPRRSGFSFPNIYHLSLPYTSLQLPEHLFAPITFPSPPHLLSLYLYLCQPAARSGQ